MVWLSPSTDKILNIFIELFKFIDLLEVIFPIICQEYQASEQEKGKKQLNYFSVKLCGGYARIKKVDIFDQPLNLLGILYLFRSGFIPIGGWIIFFKPKQLINIV